MNCRQPAEFGGEESILAYASVEYPNKELLAVNFAFPKEFVDHHLDLVAAEYVELDSISTEQVGYKLLYAANQFDYEEGKVLWEEQRNWIVSHGQAIHAEISREEMVWRMTDPAIGEPLQGIPITKSMSFSGEG